MIESDGDRFRLAISLSDAIDFALGRADLEHVEPDDELRYLVGLLAVDALEYSEQWRAAAILREVLEAKWATPN